MPKHPTGLHRAHSTPQPACAMPEPAVLCCAVQTSIKIWDLESKSVVDDLRPEFSKTYGRKAIEPYCVSLAWSADGSTLFAGGQGLRTCINLFVCTCSTFFAGWHGGWLAGGGWGGGGVGSGQVRCCLRVLMGVGARVVMGFGGRRVCQGEPCSQAIERQSNRRQHACTGRLDVWHQMLLAATIESATHDRCRACMA